MSIRLSILIILIGLSFVSRRQARREVQSAWERTSSPASSPLHKTWICFQEAVFPSAEMSCFRRVFRRHFTICGTLYRAMTSTSFTGKVGLAGLTPNSLNNCWFGVPMSLTTHTTLKPVSRISRTEASSRGFSTWAGVGP